MANKFEKAKKYCAKEFGKRISFDELIIIRDIFARLPLDFVCGFLGK